MRGDYNIIISVAIVAPNCVFLLAWGGVDKLQTYVSLCCLLAHLTVGAILEGPIQHDPPGGRLYLYFLEGPVCAR